MGIHLNTLTITLSLDSDGDEVIQLEHETPGSTAQLVGMLEMCKDLIMRAVDNPDVCACDDEP